jgi:2-polyprenyl-3-methyl-5-hydroxy-6-metoxy-1,4-benzoquinol methylase
MDFLLEKPMYRILYYLFLILGVSFFATCHIGKKHHSHHNSAQEHMHSVNFDDLVNKLEDPSREEWQKPNEVISLIHKNMGGKKLEKPTILDMGAGSGYFTFRLLEQGFKVIATDIDERFIQHLAKKASKHPKKDNLEIRKVELDKPGLNSKEVDVVLSVNLYHHIDDRVSYFKKLKNGIKDSGILYIIDFKEGNIPVGPPPEIKISTKVILEELKMAGYEVRVNEKLLPYQNIFIANHSLKGENLWN